MEQTYRVSLIVKGEDGTYHSDLSWVVRANDEDKLINKLNDLTNQLKDNYIDGMLVFSELPKTLDLNDFTYERVIEDIKNN